MANRVLLLLAMTSRNYLNSSSEILSDTAGQHTFFQCSSSSSSTCCSLNLLNVFMVTASQVTS